MMAVKGRIKGLIGAGVAALSVAGLTAAPVALAQPPPHRAGQMGRGAGRERHPELRRAMANLERAKTALQNGAHDFGGHRVKALGHVNEAIGEVQEAMKSDTQ